MEEQNSLTTDFLATGVPGLDAVLGGGLTRDRLYLVEGEPGTGKTTLALQFLNEGVRRGESTLYITLAETVVELRSVAQSHGWNMDDIHIEEIIPDEKILDPQQQYTIFHPSEIELGSTTQRLLAAIDKYQPRRVVLDSLSELQLLAESPLRYRRQVLALKQYLSSRNCTTIFLDDRTALSTDLQVRSVAHAVLTLELADQAYGAERRRLRVVKYRGVQFRGGAHDYKIVKGGLHVHPRLVAAHSRSDNQRRQLSSGMPALDALIGGGLEEGMSTLITGPSGTGKSSLAAQFVYAATQRGERCAMFLFEEARNNLLNRCTSLGLHLSGAIDNGLLSIQQIDPAELSPGEFSTAVMQSVDDGARVVVIDSLNGYLNAVPDERFLVIYLHELLTYLGQRGVVSIIVGVQQGMLGIGMTNAVDASYLADNVIMLRYFEADGEVRQAISVFKKRGSSHERTIRRFEIGTDGLHVGPVLKDFHGVLTGVPTYHGVVGGASTGK
ncbi:AAA family ATPase [Duganella sp. CY15W]|uniref:ATPase domain-containing protein n=1 Tax=Duganella sp. CY15W TaxID=2692172 RepID=UPI00137087B0|nr:ATPase domain-containing protein [Duganella sp. CY15W]MYM27000.1 AAA family ATPase [Duganella sp. CY15W]